MSDFSYGEMRLVWLAVILVIAAVGAATSGEGAGVVLALLAGAAVIFFLMCRKVDG